MIRPASLRIATLPLTVALVAPTLALASGGSGGSGVSVPGGSGAGTAKIASVTGDGITLTGRGAALSGGTLHLTGTVSPAGNSYTVLLQQQSQQGSSWSTVASAVADSDGSFQEVWHPRKSGSAALRVALAHGQRVSPALDVTVYRASIATLYGPGLWGRHTACGEKLKRNTLGVANRDLPCGTPVTLYYHGRTIVVPVIDRGPYANHANWDLTMATGAALGMEETETIGALPAQTS